MGLLNRQLKACLSQGTEPRMELYLFRILCLAATLLSFLVVIPVNYLEHLSPSINLAVLIFGSGAFFFYRESCRGRYRIASLFLLTLVVLNVTWFANGGSVGSVSYYFYAEFVYAMIFFRGGARFTLLLVAVANLVGLIALEQQFPHWIVPYQSRHDRSADLVTAVTVSALYCSLMLWAVLTSYDREQRRLTSLNEELERNIAERDQAEKSLMENRELLRAVFEGASDAIYAKDTEGRYLIFNHAAELITGKSEAEVLGRDDSFLFPPDQAERIIAKDREIRTQGMTRTVEEHLTNADGDTIVVQATKGPVCDGQGRVIGIFGISRDVTENQRIAQELGLLNEELEERVNERTARLEAAMREQEAFSYSVSHDLRGPLRHINCYAAILDEDFGAELSPEVRGYLDRIRGSSRKMGILIDDLLELSRIGRYELLKSSVDLSELAGSLCQKLQEAEPGRRAEFIIEPGLYVHGDKILLGQMLDNLIGNAWKYAGRRGCARIELGREAGSGRRAFYLRDNGVGFDMAYVDKLFGAFQRLHGAEFEGSGVGLATVKRIVERHDGDVWAQAAVGQGATFYFTLP